MHVSGELIVSHLLSAQVLRDNLPGFDLQVGVAEQHAVKVKDYAPIPHAGVNQPVGGANLDTDKRIARRKAGYDVGSVHTSQASLAAGERRIEEIQARLLAENRF